MASSSALFKRVSSTIRPGPARKTLDTAVVLGGSIAGLLAARVLSEHAERVVIIERDIQDGYDPRPGVPQGVQTHILLHAGRTQLERWFPGLTEEAVSRGALLSPIDGEGLRYENGRARVAPDTSQPPSLLLTRPFLEGLIRDRTLAIENVTCVHGRVTGLVYQVNRVSGARYIPADKTEPAEQLGDLVVDATGRGTRIGDWLKDGGWPKPPVHRVLSKINYTCAYFKRDERISDRIFVGQATFPVPGNLDAKVGGAALFTVENNRWLVVLYGNGDDRGPTDPEQFIKQAAQVPPGLLDPIVRKAEMITELLPYYIADSRRRDFHAVRRLPAGLVAVGDVIAAFNPINGQGMTAATLHASALSAFLRRKPDLRKPAWDYFRMVRSVTDGAWDISTFNDLALPHVDGPYPRFYPLLHWYYMKFDAAAMRDPELGEIQARVTTLQDLPGIRLRPSTVLKVLKNTVFAR